MGHFRFFRRVKVAPGITVNLSKSGPSLSAGPRGAKMTVGRRGVRKTVGVPGTGLYYTEHEGWRGAKAAPRKRGGGARGGREAPVVPGSSRRGLELGFFKRLVTPASEKALIAGCRALALTGAEEALPHLEEAAGQHPDGAFLAGVLHLKAERYERAEVLLEQALDGSERLGDLLEKYEIAAEVEIPIAEGIFALVGPRARGLRLALAEVHQALGQWDRVIGDLEALMAVMPDDVVVRLSLAEVLLECRPDDRGALQRVVALGKDVENESALHAALLLQRARALRRLELPVAARDLLTATLRRRSKRPEELLLSLRYERAMAYRDLGHAGRARADLERVFAEDPAFEDVSLLLAAA